MPPDHYQMIIERINAMEAGLRVDIKDLARDVKKDINGLHNKVNRIEAHGCARRADHDKRVETLEGKVAVNDAYRLKQTGFLAAVGTVGGLVGGMLSWLGHWFVRSQ